MRNSFFGNIFNTLQNRTSAVFGAIGAAALVCLCGALMTFVLGPQQALKANRVSKLPLMDVSYVTSAATDSEILITGTLNGSQASPNVPDFIAYTQDHWEITISENEQGTPQPPDGSWSYDETVIPALTLTLNGTPVNIQPSSYAALGGNLHERIVDGNGSLQAKDGDQLLREGALRYQGFFDGDQATVLGKKDSSGAIIPEDVYAGDRASYEKAQKQAAGFLFVGGIVAMICAPVVLILGVVSAALGKSTRVVRR